MRRRAFIAAALGVSGAPPRRRRRTRASCGLQPRGRVRGSVSARSRRTSGLPHRVVVRDRLAPGCLRLGALGFQVTFFRARSPVGSAITPSSRRARSSSLMPRSRILGARRLRHDQRAAHAQRSVFGVSTPATTGVWIDDWRFALRERSLRGTHRRTRLHARALELGPRTAAAAGGRRGSRKGPSSRRGEPLLQPAAARGGRPRTRGRDTAEVVGIA